MALFSDKGDPAGQVVRTRQQSGPASLAPASLNMLQNTLQGNNLYGGQGFNQAVDAANYHITPQINAQFEGKGRYGSPVQQELLAEAMARPFAQQYGQERQNQMMAPGAGLQVQQNQSLSDPYFQNDLATLLGGASALGGLFGLGGGDGSSLGGSLLGGLGKLGSSIFDGVSNFFNPIGIDNTTSALGNFADVFGGSNPTSGGSLLGLGGALGGANQFLGSGGGGLSSLFGGSGPSASSSGFNFGNIPTSPLTSLFDGGGFFGPASAANEAGASTSAIFGPNGGSGLFGGQGGIGSFLNSPGFGAVAGPALIAALHSMQMGPSTDYLGNSVTSGDMGKLGHQITSPEEEAFFKAEAEKQGIPYTTGGMNNQFAPGIIHNGQVLFEHNNQGMIHNSPMWNGTVGNAQHAWTGNGEGNTSQLSALGSMGQIAQGNIGLSNPFQIDQQMGGGKSGNAAGITSAPAANPFQIGIGGEHPQNPMFTFSRKNPFLVGQH